MNTDIRIELMPLDACLSMAHPKNPKAHDIPSLIESIKRFGFKAPPAIDEDSTVMVAGHGRCEALAKMRDAGDREPDGVRDGWLVPVIRGMRFASELERDAYIVADNQQSIRGGWDEDKLGDFLKAITPAGFAGLGFDKVDLKRWLEPPPPSAADVREVDMPPVPNTPVTKPGDVWELGRHILVCGDSCKAAVQQAVALLSGRVAIVWTDPPWNVNYGAKPISETRKRKAGGNNTIMNDALGDAFPEFCRAFIAAFTAVCEPGAMLYLAMSAQEYSMVDQTLRAAGWHWSSTIIWSKDSLVLGRKDYHAQYEPIWYGWKDGAPRFAPLADRTQSDVWEIPRPRRSEQHPTMKPVALVARSIENSSKRDELVVDPFGGSGTTVLAAEQMNRRAALVELDPRYVDVIVQRWEELSGGKARRRS